MLNAKLREVNENQNRLNIPVLMQKMRDQMQEEFQKYRLEVEQAVNRTIGEMKAKLDARLCEKQRLEEDRDRLEDIVSKLQGQINQIQSQVRSYFIGTLRDTITGRITIIILGTNTKYNQR